MNIDYLVGSLQRFPETLRALIEGLSDETYRWKPPDDAWSILEIVTHLADEEVEDFRTRVRMTLEDPTQPWPSIDPVGWAAERKYNQGNFYEALQRFLTERQNSLKWLSRLNNPNWESTYHHPQIGDLREGDVMCAWVAHDLLHLRQITKRLFQLTQEHCGEYRLDYAGDW